MKLNFTTNSFLLTNRFISHRCASKACYGVSDCLQPLHDLLGFFESFLTQIHHQCIRGALYGRSFKGVYRTRQAERYSVEYSRGIRRYRIDCPVDVLSYQNINTHKVMHVIDCLLKKLLMKGFRNRNTKKSIRTISVQKKIICFNICNHLES